MSVRVKSSSRQVASKRFPVRHLRCQPTAPNLAHAGPAERAPMFSLALSPHEANTRQQATAGKNLEAFTYFLPPCF